MYDVQACDRDFRVYYSEVALYLLSLPVLGLVTYPRQMIVMAAVVSLSTVLLLIQAERLRHRYLR